MIARLEGMPAPVADHAKNGRSLHKGAGKSSAPDPILEDCLLGATALCADIASHDLASLARAGGFSASWASEMKRTGGKGSFLHKTTVLAYRLAHRRASRAWMIVAHFKTTLKQALMPIASAELIARFHELIDLENECEGRENGAQGRMARTRDLEALKRFTLAEAAVQEELAAVIQEIQRRGLDPYAAEWN